MGEDGGTQTIKAARGAHVASAQTMRTKADIAIQWDSAEIKIGPLNSLELNVRLTDAPDEYWTDAITRLRDREWHEKPTDWWVDTPQPHSPWLKVGGVRPGGENEVREGLDAMIERANSEAAEDERKHEEAEKERTERADALKKTAADMTQRFRGSVS
jgi:hypothetical protein